jgi:hypothetical protein
MTREAAEVMKIDGHNEETDVHMLINPLFDVNNVMAGPVNYQACHKK